MKAVLISLVLFFSVHAEWESSVNQDPITDDVVRLITSFSESGHELWADILFVRVDEYSGQQYMILGFLTNSLVTGNIECIARVDDRQPLLYDLEYVDQLNALLFSDRVTAGLFDELLASNQFVIRFDTEDGKTITLIFSLQGMTQAAREAGII